VPRLLLEEVESVAAVEGALAVEDAVRDVVVVKVVMIDVVEEVVVVIAEVAVAVVVARKVPGLPSPSLVAS